MVKISLVLPCMNEEKTIGVCVEKAKQVFSEQKWIGEVIVVDNVSNDASAKIAKSKGAKVIEENEKGYGASVLAGLSNVKGEYIFISDSDNTYDLLEMPKLLDELEENDIILGSRFMGEMKQDAMPWLHRYIGNPGLTMIFNLLFGTNYSDTHTGFRVLKKNTLEKLDLSDKKFNLTLEMLAKAKKFNLRVKEIPINYYSRIAPSKLNSFEHGFGHIIFMFREWLK